VLSVPLPGIHPLFFGLFSRIHLAQLPPAWFFSSFRHAIFSHPFLPLVSSPFFRFDDLIPLFFPPLLHFVCLSGWPLLSINFWMFRPIFFLGTQAENGSLSPCSRELFPPLSQFLSPSKNIWYFFLFHMGQVLLPLHCMVLVPLFFCDGTECSFPPFLEFSNPPPFPLKLRLHFESLLRFRPPFLFFAHFFPT